MKKIVAMLLALTLILTLTACGQSKGSTTPSKSGESAAGEETIVIKLHHAQGTAHPFDDTKQHPYQVAAEHLKQYCDEKSNGSIQIEIYPANALGEDEEVLELMQEGIVDMSLVMPTSKAAAVVPELNAFNFPFLFVSAEHGEAFAETEDAQYLLDACQNHDLVGLGFSTFLFRYPLNSVRDCKTVADFKGLQLRTMDSPVALAAFAELGANTVSMSFGELYTALQLGTIDGVENDLLTLLSQNYHEVASHLSLVPIWPFASITLVSQQTWDKLSDNQKQILQDGVNEAIDVVNSEYADSINGALDILKEKGVVVSEPESMQEFVDAMQPVYDKYLPELDPHLQEIVNNIKAMGTDY
ncbi:TRAP transporter substrate-binding protein [uncultured Dysosmobacter sp.]|uniref:TRAP transporter substrate-binding protein n=1 Tax=uncultured Dysosmobacter sp. TaxID=2591384 RepID=UPI00261A7F38|nr:TRAP transporter substrate-binding protein [uncultured Dysosmobacter sp.]